MRCRLEEDEGLLLTPFEKNLEVWRQLWRVIERSQLVVQIVDARNPLLFRSADLEKYVQEVDPRKKNLLLINKADFLTERQRKAWADYFDSKDIRYTFFSATLAAKQQEEERLRQQEKEYKESIEKDLHLEDEELEDESESEGEEQQNANDENKVEQDNAADDIADKLAETQLYSETKENDQDDRIRIRTTTDLLDLLIAETPKIVDGMIWG